MRIYIATKETKCCSSTTLADIAPVVGTSQAYIRNRFSKLNRDHLKIKGWNVYRTELLRIKGRGAVL